MQYCSLGVFSGWRQHQSLCHKLCSWLLPCSSAGPLRCDPAPQQLRHWSDPCTADLGASCNSSTALHPPPFTAWGQGTPCSGTPHFPMGFESVAYYKPISKLPWSKCTQLKTTLHNVHTGTPDWVLHIQATASQTKHPAPNKGMQRKSNERRAALKAACAKAALLFIQIRTLLNQFNWSLSENI